MRTDHLYRHLLIAFALALVAYIGIFSCDQRVRHRKGPWRVEFLTSSNGHPAIRIDQPFLGITNVRVIFVGEQATNGTGQVTFRKPKQPLPFGKTKFEDLTYLPGSVAFDFFGHEVELLPRTLYLNKAEKDWESGARYELAPSDKLPPEKFYDPRKKKRRARPQAGTNSPATRGVETR